MSTPAMTFTCPGRDLPQPADAPGPGYVACYRAGHSCPTKVAEVSFTATCRFTEFRCPCCGERGVAMSEPLVWYADSAGVT